MKNKTDSLPSSTQKSIRKSAGTDSVFLPPLFSIEHGYNILTKKLLHLSAIFIALLPIPICCDIIARSFLGFAVEGITEIETLTLIGIAFAVMAYVTATRTHIAIDMFYEKFSKKTQLRLTLFAYIIAFVISGMLAYYGSLAALENSEHTPSLWLPEWWFVMYTSVGLGFVSLGMLFQVFHSVLDNKAEHDYVGILLSILFVVILFAIPFIYKGVGLSISKLALGSIGFLVLFILLLLRVPIGFAMAAIGVLGLLCIMRSPDAAWSLVADVPYRESASFVLVAIPMFMLMGELTSVSGISKDMFDCANKWLGKMPGGLACATVGGCAGFGAICGDSLPTVIAMSSVALPQMRENNYAPSLATGALAAGGTLGILIPPSMGFIFYSIMTEESIGKLFVAGIIPGILLAIIFMAIIVFQVKRNPSLAPVSKTFTLAEKIRSLLGLLPMVLLFTLVVGGILMGMFTPGEGGAVGAMGAFLYALARRQIDVERTKKALINTAAMTGRIFLILVGVYVFGTFLATSRLPALLAEVITELEMNKYFILLFVIIIYIFMGCVMNVIPMMMLTLPSIYPTIQALGFDGIWFGVITVIVMEMGMITPPIGMNVFTMASLAPDISMATIFKGVMPFFLGMCICVLLIILFPPLALWLPSML